MTDQELKQLIDDKIYENKKGEITATVLNELLKDIVDFANKTSFEQLNINTANVDTCNVTSCNGTNLTYTNGNITNLITNNIKTYKIYSNDSYIEFNDEDIILNCLGYITFNQDVKINQGYKLWFNQNNNVSIYENNNIININANQVNINNTLNIKTYTSHETEAIHGNYNGTVDAIDLLKLQNKNKLYRIGFENQAFDMATEEVGNLIDMIYNKKLDNIDFLILEGVYDILGYYGQINSTIDPSEQELHWYGKLIIYADIDGHYNYKTNQDISQNRITQRLILKNIGNETDIQTYILERSKPIGQQDVDFDQDSWKFIKKY